MISEHVPDQYTKLVKNPNYWGVEPYLDGLEYYIITEAAQALNALTTGEIDCSLNVMDTIEQVQGNKQLALTQNTEPRVTYLGFNTTHEILSMCASAVRSQAPSTARPSSAASTSTATARSPTCRFR